MRNTNSQKVQAQFFSLLSFFQAQFFQFVQFFQLFDIVIKAKNPPLARV